MVHHFLAAPFAEAARAAQYAAVLTALQADATDSLLLGNLVLEDGATPLDALVVRPHGLTLLVLVSRGGRLSIPALGYGAWQLGGAPLPGADAFDNPFEQVVQQKGALETWLRPRFRPEQANLRSLTGLVLFGAPVAYAPDVEVALNSPAAAGFQLLSDPAELPRRLGQLATPEINLRTEDLAEWAAEWRAAQDTSPDPNAPAGPPQAPPPAAPAAAPGFLGQKAKALWGWLGAADVPDDDPPYGHDPASAAARNEEKTRLEQLRLEMQSDLNAQLQGLEAREAERERSIAQLRAELAQAPPVAADATALVSRLSAETREKAALEAAMEASRAESAARNRELDEKIQQLSQLIGQLNTRPADAGPLQAPGPPAGAAPARPAAPAPGPRFRQLRAWRRRLPRVAVLTGGVAALVLAGWSLSHLGGPPPAPFQENGRWGYADGTGKPVLPAQYTAAGPFQAGRAVVATDGAYGFIDEKGKAVVAPAYDALNPYAGGYARARVGDAYTFLDEDGQEFDHLYFNALDFAEGRAAVLDHRGWYYISGPTEPDTPPVLFLEAYSFADGLARVRLADGYSFITPAYLKDPGRGTKPFGRYALATDFAEGKARVTQGGRSFVIDKAGEEVK